MRLPAVLTLALVAGMLSSADDGAGQASPSGRGVRLGPGDAVRMELYPDRAMLAGGGLGSGVPRDFYVDESGHVLLPVAGAVRVEGRDFEEVRAEVERAFAAEFHDALVRLVPLLRISVLGEVRMPGLVPVDPTMTLSDVVAAAGGLTNLADESNIRLMRGGEVVSVSSAQDIVQRRDPLVSGDQIVVGRKSWASQNSPWLIGAAASVLASVLTALLVR